jgi:hypothetical protein
MGSLLRVAAIVAGALVLSGCPDRRPQPVPGPQSPPAGGAVSARPADVADARAASAGGAGPRRDCHEYHRLFSY